jgi:hypothetical protein
MQRRSGHDDLIDITSGRRVIGNPLAQVCHIVGQLSHLQCYLLLLERNALQLLVECGGIGALGLRFGRQCIETLCDFLVQFAPILGTQWQLVDASRVCVRVWSILP